MIKPATDLQKHELCVAPGIAFNDMHGKSS